MGRGSIWTPTYTVGRRRRELLLPAPYDRVYVLYLCSQIDYYNNETALYGNDKAVYDEAMSEAMAWWRRQHCPDNTGNVQVMG